MSNNEFEKIASSETSRLIASILKGETPEDVQNPTVADKTEMDVLRAVAGTYMEILNPTVVTPSATEQPPKEEK